MNSLTTTGVTSGVIAGTLCQEAWKRQAKMSNNEILKLEKMREEARLTGKIRSGVFRV
ncbi:MAG: hypothetical protein QXL98_02560 [Thermofilaceae archaeon]